MTNDLKTKSQKFIELSKDWDDEHDTHADLSQEEVYLNHIPMSRHIAELQKIIDNYKTRIEALKKETRHSYDMRAAFYIMTEGE